ncbi:hypothetical protein HC928_00300 [bacterium]|nr:hypothetical protein [bacterium]
MGVNNVPVTVTRLHDGSQDGPIGYTSIQHFQQNAVGHEDYVGEKFDLVVSNRYEAIVKSAPEEHREKLKEQFATTAVMDVLWNNNDRHFNNLMIDGENHNLIMIDHGTAFANGLSGHRNEIALNMHKAGEQLKIPPKIHERLKNETLESTKRSMPSAPGWAQGQTYLRQKYLLHLQEEHGHIPFDRIRGTIPTASGAMMPYPSHWNNNFQEFMAADQNKELPHDMFERWSKDWMTKASSDSKHPDHEDAKALMSMQPLRSYKHITSVEPASKESLQAHFDQILPHSNSSIKDKLPTKADSTQVDKVPQREAPQVGVVDEKKTPVLGNKNKKQQAQVDEKKTPVLGNKRKKQLSFGEADTVKASNINKSLVLRNPNLPFPS